MIFDVTLPSFWATDDRIELATKTTSVTATPAVDTKNPRASQDAQDAQEAPEVPEPARIRRAGTPIDPSLVARLPAYNNPWLRIIIFLSLSALWIAAIASSIYTCGDVCPVSHHDDMLVFANLCCNCATSTPGQCPASLGAGGSSHVLGQKPGKYEATQGLDGVTL